MATSSSPTFPKPSETEAANSPDVASKPPRQAISRWSLLVAVGALLLAGSISSLLFVRHRRTAQHSKIAFGPNTSSNSAKEAALPNPTTELPLDPFVVNLADTGGHSYARIGLTLQLAALNPASGEAGEKSGAAGNESGLRDVVRDTIITVLNQEQSADLLAPDGKEHLKQAIRLAIAARNPRLKVADIYLTEFLIQQ